MKKPPENIFEIALRMMELYPCATDHHATWNGSDDLRKLVPWGGAMRYDSAKGKHVPHYKTLQEAVTAAHWCGHLSGVYPLVLPLVCDDGTGRVTVLDVDDKTLDPVELQQRADALQLPLYVRRSKSGTAHVTAFHSVSIKVDKLRRFAVGLCRALDLPDDDKIVELFPKDQDLNVPYLGAFNTDPNMRGGGFHEPGTTRGGEMTLERFLSKVEYVTDAQRDAIIKTKRRKAKKRKATSDGPAYAAAQLAKYAEELRELPQGERNKTLYKYAADMGNMVASGWIERDAVYETLRAAVASWKEQDKTLDTLRRGMVDGQEKEHPPLEDVITEKSVAKDFVERYGDELRYDHEAGRWYQWVGTYWERDDTRRAYHLVSEMVQEYAVAQPARSRFIISKRSFAVAVVKYSEEDDRIAVKQSVWDTDEMLLGTPGGVVDLRTGQLRPAEPGDMITKLTAVAPTAEFNPRDCQLWLWFLDWATGGSQALQDYIQRVAGYCLTGSIKEHAMFFNWGTGRNGKGTTMDVFSGILRDYHRTAPMETFTVSSHDRHPTELAGLRGARLVTATETEESRRWAQSRITQLTGGDGVPARFMRQDFFEYVPTYKIWISGNHKPGLRTVNEAIQRRMNLLPWTVTIPEEEKDGDLGKKLQEEWPGILRWMIDGCLAWQKQGLAPPDVVKRATNEYLEAEDVVVQWIADRCERGKNYFATTEELHQNYHNWSTVSGEYDGGKRWFAKSLDDRGYARQLRRVAGEVTRGHLGLRLRPGGKGDEQTVLDV